MANPSMQVLFLTKYARRGASSRYRTLQYLPWLERAGVNCRVEPLFDETYLIHRHRTGRGRPADILRAIVRRISALTKLRRFDLVVVEKEVLPYFPALPELLMTRIGISYTVDYDDALFHQYDSNARWWVRRLLSGKIRRVMRGASLVTAGNDYLASYARRAKAARVEQIPTVVDLDRYPEPGNSKRTNPLFVIGWVGSPATAKYLRAIAPALAEVCSEGGAVVRLIGPGRVDLPGVPVEIIQWDEGTEIEHLRQFDVGIMPLPDEPWARGKCGFKLIQYMACGIPVVASPVGVNSEIVESGVNGFLARNHTEWVEAIKKIQMDPEMRGVMGRAGREKVEKRYSLQVTGPIYTALLKTAVQKAD